MLFVSIGKWCKVWWKQEIQMTLREEIKSACEYRPFEKCDYSARISNEICCMKLEYIIEQLDSMKQTINQCKDGNWEANFQPVSTLFFERVLSMINIAAENTPYVKIYVQRFLDYFSPSFLWFKNLSWC